MIKVTIYYENLSPVGLEVKGHSGKNQYGHDLVCAAVSAIVTGGFNAFQDDEIKEIKLDDGYAKLIVKQNEVSLIKLEMLLIQLKTVQEAEPKNIVIK